MKMKMKTTKRTTPPTNRRSCASRTMTKIACSCPSAYGSSMSWDAKNVTLLKKLWAVGQSAGQIARRLGCSRNAVCGRLNRLGLKRGHKPPTAKPKIIPVSKRFFRSSSQRNDQQDGRLLSNEKDFAHGLNLQVCLRSRNAHSRC